jgi:hypothetical protein
LIVAAQDNDAPSSFVELVGLLPTAAEFHNPEEVAHQLGRMKGLA